jgi:hypothetical protein
MVSANNDEVAKEREFLRETGRRCMDELEMPYIGKILIDTAELDPSEPQFNQMLEVAHNLERGAYDGLAWRSETKLADL